MIILTRPEELPTLGAPLHLALGVFDGVHVGHQAVIGRAVEAARQQGGLAGVVTFDPHPIRVIAPAKAPSSLLATLEHKARILRKLGVDFLLAVTFDHDFAKIEAETFLNLLLVAPVKTISVGEDWRFGKGRMGDVDLLDMRSASAGYRLEAVPPVMLDGERVSSTRIRQAIRDGNLDAAAELLGRPYSVCGIVIHGKQLGRTIGFPTANIATSGAQLPPDGVWAVSALMEDGTSLNGVANLGVRPTVDGQSRSLEVHLFDFSGDLYGKEIEIRFIKFIRPEKKFQNLDELKKQISLDVSLARQISDA